jgi:hypothetical protein
VRRNHLIKLVIEGKIQGRIEVTERRRRRRKKKKKKKKKKEKRKKKRRRGKQLLDDITEKTGYWKLKEETLHRTL